MDPFQQGSEAFWNGAEQDDNPFDPESDAYTQWDMGWLEAEAEDEEND